MPFQVSPGVSISEVDLTTVVPAVSTTEGAIAGVFRWGPVEERVLVDSEATLVNRFGKPTNHNAETFFTAANFLAYSNKLYVVRAANTADTANGALNALAATGTVANVVPFMIKNNNDYDNKNQNFSVDTDVKFIAKYPGSLGNSLKISVCDSTSAYGANISLTASATINSNPAATQLNIVVGSNTATVKFANSSSGTIIDANTVANTVLGQLSTGDFIEVGNSSIGRQYLKISNLPVAPTTNATHAYFTISLDEKYGLSTDYTGSQVSRYWEFFNSVDAAPGRSQYHSSFGSAGVNDEVHIVVVDEDGTITGVPDTILEVFEGVSRATDAKTIDGAGNYYKDVVNQGSAYIWIANPLDSAGVGLASALTNSSAVSPSSISFTGGQDGSDESNVPVATVTAAYDLFRSAEDVDVSLVLSGKARGGINSEQLANYIIDNIAEVRKDCVAFVSPDRTDVVNNYGSELSSVTAFRNALRPSSYAVLDTGYKYQYDKYNDLYRYVPLNGDIAGLAVRTDDVRDPWFSPAGFNRGQIKNIVKLAYNPAKSDRDVLYKNGVNPVVTFPGQGTVLFGDKTLLAKPSAFDRINVRRLFIVLEKAIAVSAKALLFEFNDEFTRAQFKNTVEPFLRDVQGRRGIYEYRVVCDETNNTPGVIDRNEFVGDIYIKPAKSINFIQLNFVAVRTGVEFSEIAGTF